ncbi:PREDICTED: uncharacterized protein LOC108375534, partial [Rhagoletis zephyria]|uniref:uncharacterized protein LOC108375534 n=1 Tax=Rhagoletis zephyria TaxID=28612 RepID=UPI000811411E
RRCEFNPFHTILTIYFHTILCLLIIIVFNSPVFASVTHRDDIHCLLIMSTLSPEEVSFYDSCHETEVQETAALKTARKRKLKPSKAANQSKSLKQDLKQKCIAAESTLSNSSSLFQFESCRDKQSFPSSLGIPRNNDRPANAKSVSYRSMLKPVSMEVEISQITHNQTDSSVTVRETDVPKFVGSSTSDDEDCIPESPKRQERADLRTIFSRCFHSTYVPVEPSASSQIYATASDTED